MGQVIGYIVNYGFVLFVAVIAVIVAVRLIITAFSKQKCEKAVVINKFTGEGIAKSKYNMAFPQKTYTVVFRCGNKTRAFNVSEFSYNGYKINEKGILKYKGNRLIDFSSR